MTLGLLSAVAQAAPPVQRPGDAAAPGEVEPAKAGPGEIAPAEPAEPAEGPQDEAAELPGPTVEAPVEPVEPTQPVEPPTSTLPRWDASPSAEPVPPPDLPPGEQAFDYLSGYAAPIDDPGPPEMPLTGHGRMAAGGVLIVGGVGMGLTSGFMLLGTEDWALGAAGLVLAAGSVITGNIMLASGAGRRIKYRAWAEQYGGHRAIPAPGAGMIASGSISMTAGALAMVLGGVSLTLQDEQDWPLGQVFIPLGAVAVASGVTLLSVGLVRKKKFEAWRDQHGITPSFSLLPHGSGETQRVAGATLGLVGRF